MGKLFSGKPAQYAPEECPERGEMLWSDHLEGGREDAPVLYCRLCGVAVRRLPYQAEARRHPGDAVEIAESDSRL